MKKLSLLLVVLVAIAFSACAKHQPKVQDDYYDRANKAAAESHKGLNRE